ncbi:MAG: tol-pal system YbgF family protein [Saprospiraceae bacterium]
MIDSLKKYLSKENLSDDKVTDITEALLQSQEDYNLRGKWEKDLKQIRQKQKRRKYAIGVTIVAIVTILALIFVLNSQQEEVSAIPYAQNYLQESPYPISQYRGETTVTLNLLKAQEAYEQKDYKTAIRYFEVVAEENKLSANDQFYLGLAYLYDNKTEQSLANFQALEQTQSTTFQFGLELRFFLGVNHILLKQNKEAKTYLESLKGSQWERATIDALLEKIDREE